MKRKYILLICIVIFQLTNILFAADRKGVPGANVLKGDHPKVNIAARNVCMDHGILVGCLGDSANGIPPKLGWYCSPWNFSAPYISLASFDSISELKGVETQPFFSYGISPKPVYVAGDDNIFLFQLSYTGFGQCNTPLFVPTDTLSIDSLKAIKATDTHLLAISSSVNQPNFFVFNSSGQPVFSLTLSMRPKVIAASTWDTIYVAGERANGTSALIVIALSSQSVVRDTVFGNANPKKMFSSYDHVAMLSSPGDSMITIHKYVRATGAVTNVTAFNTSGARTATSTDFSGSMYFQPFNDTSATMLHKKISRFNTNNMTSSQVYNINKTARTIAYDMPYSQNSGIINVMPDDSMQNSRVYFYNLGNLSYLDSMLMDPNPEFFVDDYRCSVGIDEYDDSKVRFALYPNPANNEINISVSGLICGRNYELDLTDIRGKILHKLEIRAKENFSIPLQEYKAGIYFIRLHTRQGIMTEKIIKM